MAATFKQLLFKQSFFLVNMISLTLLMVYILHAHKFFSVFLYRSIRYSFRRVQTIENKTNLDGAWRKKTTQLYVSSSSTLSKRRHKSTACVIPELDPLDPEIFKYLTKSKVEECPIRNLARIEGEILILKADNINDAGYRYIQRVNDFNVKLSSWNSLVTFRKKQINEGKYYLYPQSR